MKFLDQAKIYVRSGNGGAGCAGFRREKFIEFGGPDGGDGGRGGDVILECVDGLNTLIDYRYAQHFKAETGHHGMGSQRTGGAGKDITLRLPRGTQVFAEDNETLLADLTEIGQRIVLLKGGDGGYGNLHYKSSTNRAPRRADKGWPGEELWIWLRLKLIADVGLVGLPNAGKSTFLAATSNARPKIADYPFTTLTPGLGVVKVGDREFVMADIPGLIEGAHEGSGLGTRFLGHVERCRALLHLVDGTQDDIVGAYRTVRGRAEGLWRQPGAQEGSRGAEQDRRHDRRGHRGQARPARQGQPQGGARDLRRLGPRRAAPAARADEARREAARHREGSRVTPLEEARRLVIKIGSSILVDETRGEVRRDWLESLTDSVARLHKGGCEIVLVSSGAIRLGRTQFKLPPGPLKLEESQAAAATGQIQLAHAYQEALARHGITVAQVLLTLDDSEERRRYLNARQTMGTLAGHEGRAGDQRERHGGDRRDPLRRQRSPERPRRRDDLGRHAGAAVGHRRPLHRRSAQRRLGHLHSRDPRDHARHRGDGRQCRLRAVRTAAW